MLPSGTAKWHRQASNGDDRARWRGRKRKWHRQTSEEDVRARWKDKENENGQLLAPTFHLERRAATEMSIPPVRVPGGGILLPPGTANRLRQPSHGNDRAWWKDRKEQRLRRSPSGDDRARWKAWKAGKAGKGQMQRDRLA